MLQISAANLRSECGGKIRVYSPGNLTTPGYPGNYPKDSFCIWLLEAKDGYIVQLTIHQFNGHSLNNSCRDFIQIRDGSSASQELLYSCNTTNKIVNSTSRRLWIKFKSDSLINNKGLTSSWDTHYTGVTSENISSLLECVNSFQCSNDECVSKSSQCDGVNDCGCMDDCDEHKCDKTEISFGAQMAIGISIGVALFAILFCGTLFIEWRNKWTKNITSNGRPHKPNLSSKEADSEVTERLGASPTNNVAQSPEGYSTPTAATSLTITSMDTGKNASSSLLQSSAASSSSPSSTITTTTAKTPPESVAPTAASTPTPPQTAATTTTSTIPPATDNTSNMNNNKFTDEGSEGTASQSVLL